MYWFVTASTENDRDFDPSADMLVDDFDDEQTLQEEEQLSNSDASNELDELQKVFQISFIKNQPSTKIFYDGFQEGDMPLEELLAMYGAPPESSEAQGDSRSSSEEEIIINRDLTLDKDQVAQDLLRDDEDSNKETSANDLLQYVKLPSHTARLLRCEYDILLCNSSLSS